MISSTVDDAAGEAFDKGGKLLGLSYPAGREIDERSKEGNKQKYSFPIGLKHSKDGKMSFSGVKTSLRRLTETTPQILNFDRSNDQNEINNVCASYQEAIVQAINLKTKEVLNLIDKSNELPLVLGGGVACNSRLSAVLKENFSNVFLVKPSFCTDNGAMIANYAARTPEHSINYPKCLTIDAKNRFVPKKSNEKRRQQGPVV